MCLFPGQGPIFADSFWLILSVWDFLKGEPEMRTLVYIPRPNTFAGQLQKHREGNLSSVSRHSVHSGQLCVAVILSLDPRAAIHKCHQNVCQLYEKLRKPCPSI